jgi:hypothetical protein
MIDTVASKNQGVIAIRHQYVPQSPLSTPIARYCHMVTHRVVRHPHIISFLLTGTRRASVARRTQLNYRQVEIRRSEAARGTSTAVMGR